MVVHSGQVEALEADAGHPVLDLLRPQLRRLLLLLDQPLRRSVEKKKKGQPRSRTLTTKHISVSAAELSFIGGGGRSERCPTNPVKYLQYEQH